MWTIFGFDSFCWFGGLCHGLSHGSTRKVAEQCSQDKCPDPTEAAGGGQLMDGRGRISQLPSNLCAQEINSSCHWCLPWPCRSPFPAQPALHPTLLCQPGNTVSGSGEGEDRGGMRGTTRSVLSLRPLPAASLLHEHGEA